MWGRSTRARTLAMGFAAGRLSYPEIEVPIEAWRQTVLGHINARTGRSDPHETEALLAATHSADLYLAIACDLGLPNVWERFLERYEALLESEAEGLTVGLPKRDRFVADFLAELFKGRAARGADEQRTRLGDYDGSASLGTWLRVLLLDKALRTRDRLQSVQVDESVRAVAQLKQTEHGTRIAGAIASTWHSLDATQQLAIALHYRESPLPLPALARVLRRSEAQARNALRESLEHIRNHAPENLEGSLPRPLWLDFQLWFEHELQKLTKGVLNSDKVSRKARSAGRAAVSESPINASLDLFMRHELPPAELIENGMEIDANRVASWLDDGMTSDERELFKFEAALSSNSRRLICRFQDHEAVLPPELETPKQRSALAIALVVALPLAGLAFTFTKLPENTPERTTEAQLEQDARDLGFDALPLSELLEAPPPLVIREDEATSPLRAIWPQGHVLQRRIRFRWTPPKIRGQVTVRHVSGTIVCHVAGESPLNVPPRSRALLQAGETYIWELTPTDGAAAATPRSFTLAGDAEREHFQQFITRASASPMAELLIAHYALRLDHLDEAQAATQRWLERHPEDVLGLATLWQTLKRLESPVAGAVKVRLHEQYERLRMLDRNEAHEALPESSLPAADR